MAIYMDGKRITVPPCDYQTDYEIIRTSTHVTLPAGMDLSKILTKSVYIPTRTHISYGQIMSSSDDRAFQQHADMERKKPMSFTTRVFLHNTQLNKPKFMILR